jgi:hypothetical protein
MLHFAQTETQLDRISADLENITSRIFNWESLILLFSLLVGAFFIGRVIALLLRHVNHILSRRADKSKHLPTVERYRRTETIVVISIALIRVFLFAFALYLWWVIEHPGQQPTALIGASAIFAVLAGGVFGPILRDLATGSMMMTEHWFGVGDHIKVEPFGDMQGVVERVTLRSTRIRGINGEVIWVNNQNIQAVRVTTKGLRTIAIELFVSDPKIGQRLIEETDLRLPSGPLMVAKPLSIMDINEVGNEEHSMWHITAIAQTAPGREWLIEKYAIEVIQELDKKRKNPVLKSDPIARNADSVAEQKFARAIRNARKVSTKQSITAQIQQAAKEAKERSGSRKKRKTRRVIQ